MYREDRNEFLNKGRTRSLEELVGIFPNEPYIVVFGTSHTSGACEIGEYTHIDVGDRWCNIVANHYGLPVVNLSLPGNYNRFLVQQVIDFLELPNVKNHCKLALLEARIGDVSGRYYFDLFADEPDGRIPFNRHIVNSDELRGISWMDSICGPFVPVKHHKSDYVRSLVLNANPKFGSIDMIPESALATMESLIKTHTNTVLMSQQQAIEDLLDIRTMQHLLTSNDIPFRFFVWDVLKVGINKYYQDTRKVYDELYNMNDYTFKSLLPSVGVSATMELGNQQWNIDWNCDCGHRNEKAHRWVAEKIIPELKEVL